MTPQREWILPDEFFRTEVRKGYYYAAIVGLALRARGIAVELPPLALVSSHDEIAQFEDEWDLRVGTERLRLEVKSHRKPYTGPSDFPYRSVLVDTRHGWDRKKEIPCAEVLISQQTLGMCVIPPTTKGAWTINQRYDTQRNMMEEFYEMPRELLRTFDEFAAWVLTRDAAELKVPA